MMWTSSEHPRCNTDLYVLLTVCRALAAERALLSPPPPQAASWHRPWLP